MANVLVEEQYLRDIADAIRTKNKTQDDYTPGQMDDAILEIETDKPDQQVTVDPTTEQQIITPDEGYELSQVTVNAVTSSIDNNITSENIKDGVTILGVTGSLEEPDNYSYITKSVDNTLTKIHDSVANLDQPPYNRYILEGYDCNFNETTYVLSITGDNVENNMSFADIVSEQADNNYLYTDWGMGYKNGDYRYVYLCFMNSNINNDVKIIIYKCDFKNNTKTEELNTTLSLDMLSFNLQWVGIRPSMYNLDFLLKTSMLYNGNKMKVSHIYCAFNNNNFVLTRLNNSESTIFDSYDNLKQLSAAGWYNISDRLLKGDPLSSKFIVTENKTVSTITPLGGSTDIMGVNTSGTKAFCVNLHSNPIGHYVYDVDYSNTPENTYFKNRQQITILPEELTSDNSDSIMSFAPFSTGFGFYGRTYKDSKYYFYDGIFSFVDNTCIIKNKTQINRSAYRRPGGVDYSTCIYSDGINKYTITEIKALIGMEYDNNNWYKVNELDNTAIASDVLQEKYAATSTGVIKGTMINNGVLNYTPSTQQQTIPEGYTSGGIVDAVTSSIDSNIQPENIKEGVTILGTTGTFQGGVMTQEEYNQCMELTNTILGE